jgi:hypothetical protein
MSRETISVYSENQTEHTINAFHRRNTELVKAKAGFYVIATTVFQKVKVGRGICCFIPLY